MTDAPKEPAAPTTAIAPIKESPQMVALRDMLVKYKDRIGAVLPKVLTVDRLLQLSLAAAGRNRRLLDCTPVSILKSVMVCGQLGLDPTGVLGHAYLIPFKRECTVIVGYKGLLDLARRSERVLGIEAHVVYTGEKFEYTEGIDKVLKHWPMLSGLPDVKTATGAYAMVRLVGDPVPMTEWMTREQIEDVRRRSRAGQEGPWVTDWGQMARKTVLRRILNYAPLSPEAQKAIAIEDRMEEGETEVGDLIDMPVLDEGGNGGAAESKSAAMAARLKEAGVGPQPSPAGTTEQTPLEISADEQAQIQAREQAEADRQRGARPPEKKGGAS